MIHSKLLFGLLFTVINSSNLTLCVIWILQYQLYTLVAFDGQQNGVPIAWVVSSRNTSSDIVSWLEVLMNMCYELRPDWKVNAFMVDDALAEIDALR